MSASSRPRSAPPFSGRRRCAIVGLGSRNELDKDAIETADAAHAELVGLCDTNPGRIELARRRSVQNAAPVPPGYAAADFARMLAETKPDTVIVTTTDSAHHDYIVRAMEAGCDVITEKPMTIDAEKCRAIIETRRRTGRRCRVTFNYRYSPPRSQVKDILMGGEIGEVLSVDFHWLLNTHHGADYFRRWHSHRRHSGGLLVHKSTHHFDLMNWWLGAVPATASASGERAFYTPAMARRLGLGGPHERCRTCPEQPRCGFALDLAAHPDFAALYLDAEHHDGYHRDRCVFRDDIEDTMSVVVGYDNGVRLSYSLNAFNAWEGNTVAFNGTRGRLEHTFLESVYADGTDTAPAALADGGVTTRIVPLRGAARDLVPWTAAGDHGGGDRRMLEDIFLPDPMPDKYLPAADERSGAWSILVGIAANRSIETGATTRIADLVSGVARPDYAPMPARDAALPMPARV